jgi:hypothetical protein
MSAEGGAYERRHRSQYRPASPRQGVQAAEDVELLHATRERHPDAPRILKWTNTMFKNVSSQVLTS